MNDSDKQESSVAPSTSGSDAGGGAHEKGLGWLGRRKFIAALGAAATSASFLESFAKGQDGVIYYQDSFGDIVAATPDVVNFGLPLPSVPAPVSPDNSGIRPLDAAAPCPSSTSIADNWVSPNILMIMVDQLRAPRWLPATGQPGLDSLLPNLAYLRNHSYSYSNYYVAATACTPSRSTLLTGLYAQQTCLFQTQAPGGPQPDLQVGFPNIATVLSQAGISNSPNGTPWKPYRCNWIGKWHLSDSKPLGSNGPSGYGFLPIDHNLPKDNTVASPNGTGNLGTEGSSINPNGWHPTAGPQPGTSSYPPSSLLPLYADAAIVDFFETQWLPNLPAEPWFAAVSLVNPHDISQFPFCFNLAGTTGFGTPANPPGFAFPSPLVAGSPGQGSGQQFDDTYLPALSQGVYTSTPGNYPDAPAGYNGGAGKPDLQTFFKQNLDIHYGSVTLSAGWIKFLNYYLWMQTCVDYQIGRIITQLTAPAHQSWASKTVVIFHSDHGEAGGSHSLKAKGGALYDEIINVPLYISLPGHRTTPPALNPQTYPFVCSSVDILPFLYALALGSDHTWRINTCDLISYLNKRESIFDSMYVPNYVKQYRISGIQNNSGGAYHGQNAQPFIIHTADEYAAAIVSGSAVPSHALCFRTVDLTVSSLNPDGVTVNGGGKLGIYSFWPNPSQPPTQAQTQPDTSRAQQYEFYDYTLSQNYGETGNEYLTSSKVPTYVSAFGTASTPGVGFSELYPPESTFPAQLKTPYDLALAAYLNSSPLTVDPTEL